MPDSPRPADASRPADEAPDASTPATAAGASPTGAAATTGTPDEAELVRVAVPATVRRAPRYGAFMVAGALVGMVVGLVVAVATAAGSGVTGSDGGVLPFLGGQNGVRWLLAVAGGVVGAFVGGGLAVLADRRSTRGRGAAPRA